MYVTRPSVVPLTSAGSYALCLKASKKTKTSSAPTPSTTKIDRIWMLPCQQGHGVALAPISEVLTPLTIEVEL